MYRCRPDCLTPALEEKRKIENLEGNGSDCSEMRDERWWEIRLDVLDRALGGSVQVGADDGEC